MPTILPFLPNDMLPALCQLKAYGRMSPSCLSVQVGIQDANYITTILRILLPVALEVLGYRGSRAGVEGWSMKAGGLMKSVPTLSSSPS